MSPSVRRGREISQISQNVIVTPNALIPPPEPCHSSCMNPFRRILDLFRPKPAMFGMPPSASQVPLDAGVHARDFAKRYTEPMNYHVENRIDQGWGASDPLLTHSSRRSQPARVNRNTDSGPP